MNHQYIRLAEVDKLETINDAISTRKIPGALVACAVCGRVKEVFADGQVKVIMRGIASYHQDDNDHTHEEDDNIE